MAPVGVGQGDSVGCVGGAYCVTRNLEDQPRAYHRVGPVRLRHVRLPDLHT